MTYDLISTTLKKNKTVDLFNEFFCTKLLRIKSKDYVTDQISPAIADIVFRITKNVKNKFNIICICDIKDFSLLNNVFEIFSGFK